MAEVCGRDGVLVGAEACAPYARDWTGAFVGRPAAVVRPADTRTVAAVLAFCSARGLAVVPQGGRTGLVGAGAPADGEIVLSLERMRAVRRLDSEAGAVVVEAGATLAAVEEALADSGWRMPVDLASRGSAQVGGLLATAAGGMRHVRDGALAARVRGLEVVLGDGRVLSNLSTLEKNNTGYAWAQLFCGSEGTLGVITAAAIGLARRAAAARAAWLALARPDVLAEAVDLVQRAALGLVAAVEFVHPTALAALAEARPELRPPVGDAPLHLVVEVEAADAPAAAAAAERLAEEALARGLADDAAIAQSGREVRDLWQVREALPEAIGRLGRVRRYDVAVPVGRLVDLVEEVCAAVAARGLAARPVAFGHAAEGNVHLNAILGAGWEEAMDGVLDELVYGAVLARGGTISAEHGIGRLKRDRLALMRTPEEIAFMAALKAVCDPAGILSPGRLLPASALPPRLEAGEGAHGRPAGGPS